ncbi:hypothetical protein KBC40_00080 [Patescibacteria group bacterium]|nr:hypothetical protein [Patescibacteria group bacterium]
MFDNLEQKNIPEKAKTGPEKWQDFWLPSENNDYHPHSLQFRRMFFYASTAVLMKVIVALFVVALPITAWLTPDILTQESKKIVSLTNDLRQSLNVPVLTENQTLNLAAYGKAEDMLLQQYFAHIGPDGKRVSSWLKDLGYDYYMAGENLAMGFASAEEVVEAWKNSPTHYANLVDPSFTEIGVSMLSGEYNGMDTSLVAQMFAYPKIVVVADEIVVPAPENQVPTPEVVETPKPVETKIIQATKVPVTPKPVVVQTQNSAPVVEVVENQPANDLKNANLVSEENIVISAGIETPEETVVDLLEPKEDLVLENVEANNTREEIVTLSETNELVTDVTPPEVDLLKTKIIIDQPDNKAEAIIKIDAYLSLDTQEVFVSWAGEKISLANVGDGHWVAYATLTAEQADKILNPIILPNITAIDAFANKSVVDLGLEQIKPVKTSLLNQYFFLKKINADGAGTLFNISIIYYKIFALLLSIALALNIFVHIKKQNYRVIGSAAMFLILLALLIIF